MKKLLSIVAVCSFLMMPSLYGGSEANAYQGRLASSKNLNLWINAWGGAKHGTVVRLFNNCPTSNPDCIWIIKKNGMIVSARNQRLALNAWGGAKHGTVLRLHQSCTASNPDCRWIVKSNGMIVSARNQRLAINAWGGAKQGTTLRLHQSCTAGNPDCAWTSNALQPHWRWCSKCSALFYSHNKAAHGRCPAGGAHDATKSGSYSMSLGNGTQTCTQKGWRWCSKCQGMFYSANKTTFGRCPAGGAHDARHSGHYHPQHGHSCQGNSQSHWRWCHKCSSLFYSNNQASFGRCPAGGAHDATKSGKYFINMAPSTSRNVYLGVCGESKNTAQVARTAYNGASKKQQYLPSGFRYIREWNNGSTHAYLAIHTVSGQQVCHYSFRGLKSFWKSLGVWGKMGKSKNCTTQEGVSLGTCISQAYDRYTKIRSFLRADILKRTTNGCGGGIRLSGHSMGGAMASILAAELYTKDSGKFNKNYMKLYTYGAPRVFKSSNANHWHSQIAASRWVYTRKGLEADHVPSYPRKTDGFSHFGTPYRAKTWYVLLKLKIGQKVRGNYWAKEFKQISDQNWEPGSITLHFHDAKFYTEMLNSCSGL